MKSSASTVEIHISERVDQEVRVTTSICTMWAWKKHRSGDVTVYSWDTTGELCGPAIRETVRVRVRVLCVLCVLCVVCVCVCGVCVFCGVYGVCVCFCGVCVVVCVWP